MSKTTNSDLLWAEEVLLVHRHLGGRIDSLESPSAQYLCRWVNETAKNAEKFFTTMVPKAIDTLAKYSSADSGDAVAAAEKHSIADLKERLQEALEEAQGSQEKTSLDLLLS